MGKGTKGAGAPPILTVIDVGRGYWRKGLLHLPITLDAGPVLLRGSPIVALEAVAALQGALVGEVLPWPEVVRER
jgi:hypothetical protein